MRLDAQGTESRTAVNADLSRRVTLDTQGLEWMEEPDIGGWVKPLARVCGDTWAHTVIARFSAGAPLAACCAEGAELLVLAGGLTDADGQYPVGSYLRLPPRQAGRLATPEGCELFLRRGYPDTRSGRRMALPPDARVWHPGLVPGLRVLSLAESAGAHAALVAWAPGTRFQYHRHYGGEEIFVMSGVFQDELGDYPAGTWLRSPHLSEHVPFSEQGCLIFVKVGHLPPPG